MKVSFGVVVSLALGMLAGAAAIVAYAVLSDQDVREVFAKVRKDVETFDIDAASAQVQQGIADVEARVEEEISKVKAMADDASNNGPDVVADAAKSTPIAKG